MAVVSALTTLLLPGCGKREGRPKDPQAVVTGSVVLGGKPVAVDTSIVFFCQEKDATAAGKVDSQGKFHLKAARASIGIPVGRYVVMVRPPEPPMPVKAATGNSSADYQKAMQAGGVAKRPTSSDIPVELLSFATSKLTQDLKAGPNTCDIDLSNIPK